MPSQSNAAKKVTSNTAASTVQEVTIHRLKGLLEQGDVKSFNMLRPEGEIDLTGLNISPGTDLSGVNLSHADLTQAFLKECKLVGADFEQAKLIAADLRGSDITDLQANGANFNRADLRRVVGTGARFRRSINPAQFKGALLMGATLEGAEFPEAQFEGARVGGGAFLECDFTEADLTSVIAGVRTSFEGSTFERATLHDAQISNSNFAGTNLTDSKWRGARGKKTSFRGALLHKANMVGIKLMAPDFRGAFVQQLRHKFGEKRAQYLKGAFADREADPAQFRKSRYDVADSKLIANMPGTDKQLLIQVQDRVNERIGHEEPKERVSQMIDEFEVDALARRLGEHVDPFDMHLLFEGPPGTGKTSVGEDWGQLAKAFGYLKKGHTVYVPGRELIVGKVGQSEEKTRQFIEMALDGVLFVDEAHQLAKAGSNADFGPEVIGTISPAMTRYAGRLVVIFAGYPGKMDGLYDLDPGLFSRITDPWKFKSFESGQLVDILQLNLGKEGKNVSHKFLAGASALSAVAKETQGERFGNGRFVVKGLLGVAKRRQKTRLKDKGILTMDEKPSEQRRMLRSLLPEDLPAERILGRSAASIPYGDLKWAPDENVVVSYSDLNDYLSEAKSFPNLHPDSLEQLVQLSKSK
jgi:uncharacterized protein YjbI with pentapeptide repeats